MNGDPGNNTLLAHLAWRLSNRHEDIAVETLGFILRSDATRNMLQQVVQEGGANIGPIARVATQVGGEEGTRPDLVGWDQGGDESVLIEAKFWASLTGNQPNAYLNRLAPGNALLVVAPDLRVESLWAELCRRAEVDVPDPTDQNPNVKSVEVPDQKWLVLTSWAHLLERLELAGDEQANVSIRQLRGLATRVDESSFPPLRTEELAPNLARRLLGLRKLVDDATVRGREAGFLDTHRLIVTPKPTGYGRYLRIGGVGAWFGLDFSRWAFGSYPSTPLWLWFEDWGNKKFLPKVRVAMRPRIRANPPRCFDEKSLVVVPIGLPERVEYETVLTSVVEQMESVANEF